MSVEVVVQNSCTTVGEGPHWDDVTKRLLYVDISCGDIHRWDPATGNDEKVHVDDTVGFVIPCKTGGYIIGKGKSLCHFDWDTGKVEVLKEIDQGKKTRFNDGKCDPAGRLWAGTMAKREKPSEVEHCLGSLYLLDKDRSVTVKRDLVSISNGLAWSKDCNTMYYIDSLTLRVFAFDYNIKEGTMSNGRVAVSFGGFDKIQTTGFPDGMAIDTEDMIWVACYGTGTIVRFDPKTGERLKEIQFPAMRITSCCFGCENLDTLYVTSSREGMTDEESEKTPLAGSVFKVTDLGVTGCQANVYEG